MIHPIVCILQLLKHESEEENQGIYFQYNQKDGLRVIEFEVSGCFDDSKNKYYRYTTPHHEFFFQSMIHFQSFEKQQLDKIHGRIDV